MRLFLLHLQVLVIGVIEEYEVFACRHIGPDGLVSNAQAIQFRNLLLNIIYLEGQMPQSCRLGKGRTLRR